MKKKTIKTATKQNSTSSLPFQLGLMENLLQDYKIPEHKSRKRKYKMFSLAAGSPQQAGSLFFHTEIIKKSFYRLNLKIEKTGAAKNKQITQAEISYKIDLYATPMKWQYSSKMIDPQGEIIKNTFIKKSAKISDNQIIISSAGSVEKIDFNGNITMNWLLFDKARSMINHKNSKLDFTLIDHFDEIKPNNILYYNNEISVDLAQEKNIKLLDDKPLFLHIVDTLLQCSTIDEIYIDTESDDVFSFVGNRPVKRIIRPKELASNNTDGNALLLFEASQISTDILVQVMATGPFLLRKTIDEAVFKLISDDSYDSVFMVHKLKKYLWKKTMENPTTNLKHNLAFLHL